MIIKRPFARREQGSPPPGSRRRPLLAACSTAADGAAGEGVGVIMKSGHESCHTPDGTGKVEGRDA